MSLNQTIEAVLTLYYCSLMIKKVYFCRLHLKKDSKTEFFYAILNLQIKNVYLLQIVIRLCRGCFVEDFLFSNEQLPHCKFCF